MKTSRRDFLKTAAIASAALLSGALRIQDIETIYPEGCPYCGIDAEYDTMSDVNGRYCHEACWDNHIRHVRSVVLQAYDELDALPHSSPQRLSYGDFIRAGDTQEIAALKVTGRI